MVQVFFNWSISFTVFCVGVGAQSWCQFFFLRFDLCCWKLPPRIFNYSWLVHFVWCRMFDVWICWSVVDGVSKCSRLLETILHDMKLLLACCGYVLAQLLFFVLGDIWWVFSGFWFFDMSDEEREHYTPRPGECPSHLTATSPHCEHCKEDYKLFELFRLFRWCKFFWLLQIVVVLCWKFWIVSCRAGCFKSFIKLFNFDFGCFWFVFGCCRSSRLYVSCKYNTSWYRNSRTKTMTNGYGKVCTTTSTPTTSVRPLWTTTWMTRRTLTSEQCSIEHTVRGP